MGLAVIGSGFGRTGTMSLKAALDQLGFGPCHHMEEIVTAQEVYLEALWRITPYGENLSGFAGLGR